VLTAAEKVPDNPGFYDNLDNGNDNDNDNDNSAKRILWWSCLIYW
jgi:hypothetical protein